MAGSGKRKGLRQAGPVCLNSQENTVAGSGKRKGLRQAGPVCPDGLCLAGPVCHFCRRFPSAYLHIVSNSAKIGLLQLQSIKKEKHHAC